VNLVNDIHSTMKLFQNFKGLDLPREKLKDFKNVVPVQIALLLTTFLAKGIMELFHTPYSDKITELLFFSILGVYVFLLWDMLRNYTKSRTLLLFLLVLIMGTFLTGVIFVNPFIALLEMREFRIVTCLIMATLLMVETFVVYFTITEIFKHDLSVSERMWGAACIYLITGIAFGSVYEIIDIISISSLDFGIPLGTLHFIKSISFSFHILAGTGISYPCSELVTNITTIESLWGNLFIVFVVGRLLI
jgi:hypothetical protein